MTVFRHSYMHGAGRQGRSSVNGGGVLALTGSTLPGGTGGVEAKRPAERRVRGQDGGRLIRS